MNEATARFEETTPRHFEDELRSRIYEYERYMEIHRIKVKAGILETTVVTIADILGNLLKVRWGDAAKAIFSVRKQKLALLEEELKAPNREIAYIVHAKETFAANRGG